MNKMGFGLLRLPQAGRHSAGGPGGFDWPLIARMTDAFLDLGGKYFDTCYTYLNGYSEMAVKKCLSERVPRDRFLLADKLPGYMCRSRQDAVKYFEEELRRCGVDYFDVYMLHWLNEAHYRKAEQLDQFGFLEKMKKEGKAVKTGFSYHDSAALLDEILGQHPEIDVVQLQINYLDWDTAGIESGKCYETAVRHGKQVYVMEPVKGGSLANLPSEAMALLQSVHPDRTAADWALRFVQSLPGVEICLSGMNTMEQMQANMQPVEPLSEAERELLFRAAGIILANTRIPCTGCGYCVSHCPENIAIPDFFKMYNELCRYPEESWKIEPVYRQKCRQHGKASQCIGCGSCARHCPQNIRIPEYLKKVADAFE